MGSLFSCVAPATGRLMLLNSPPDGASHFQTFGGTYVSWVGLLSVVPDMFSDVAEVEAKARVRQGDVVGSRWAINL
jgi:hypothetical protein